MSTTTDITQIKLNIMTQAQYNSATKSATEFYMVTDALTVTSVNNINPVSGNVTLTASNVGASVARSTVTDTTSTSITLANADSNTDYHYGTLTSLTVTANDTSDSEINIFFTAGATISVSLPATLTYIGSAPTFEANKSYVISILNNILISGEVA